VSSVLVGLRVARKGPAFLRVLSVFASLFHGRSSPIPRALTIQITQAGSTKTWNRPPQAWA
jgi:hypothetical protein